MLAIGLNSSCSTNLEAILSVVNPNDAEHSLPSRGDCRSRGFCGAALQCGVDCIEGSGEYCGDSAAATMVVMPMMRSGALGLGRARRIRARGGRLRGQCYALGLQSRLKR